VLTLTSIKYYWINQIFFKVTTIFFKISLCYVYHFLFRKADTRLIRITRWVNYFTAFIVVTYYSAALIVSIFNCIPVAKIWSPGMDGHCIGLNDFRISTAVVNIVTSVLIIATPLPALWKLMHRRIEVTELIILILLGVVHTGCTIVRLLVLIYPDPNLKKDPQCKSTLPLSSDPFLFAGLVSPLFFYSFLLFSTKNHTDAIHHRGFP
jgi:hypothetical protein